MGLVDLAHRAAAELADDLVLADPLAIHAVTAGHARTRGLRSGRHGSTGGWARIPHGSPCPAHTTRVVPSRRRCRVRLARAKSRPHRDRSPPTRSWRATPRLASWASPCRATGSRWARSCPGPRPGSGRWPRSRSSIPPTGRSASRSWGGPRRPRTPGRAPGRGRAAATCARSAWSTPQGRAATHTGALCIPAAGGQVGKEYVVQANLMEKPSVWPAMARAYEAAKGDLADRLLAALDAAEAEGGDIRGRQSAAHRRRQGPLERPALGRPRLRPAGRGPPRARSPSCAGWCACSAPTTT